MSEVVKKELPEGWAWTIMDEISDVVGGGTPKSKEKRFYDGGTIPWLTPADLSKYKEKYASGGARYITEEGLSSSSAKMVPAGTVLFTSRAPIGYVVIAKNAICTNQGFKSFVLKTDKIIPDYVYWWLKGNKQLAESFASGTTFLELSGSKAKQLPIPIAPLEQQKRIVAKIEELFSHIDAGIAALNKAKQLLKQYRQSVLKAAVTGELTKQWREDNKDKLEPASQLLERVVAERVTEYSRKVAGWEVELKKWKTGGEDGKKPSKPQKLKNMSGLTVDLEPLPDGWCWLRLGNLAVDVFDGPFGSNLKSNDYVDEGVRVIRLENIGSLEFKDKKLTYVTEAKYESLKKHTVSSGDIIFSSFVADGTRVVVLPEDIDRAINKADCFCVRPFGDSIDANYLANFLSTTSTYKRLENQVHGATRPRINTTQLKELEIPICSEAEQLAIIKFTSEKFDASDRLEKEIDIQLVKSDKNMQSILASAFSGNI
jgi:type I restriction enzyme S subunit